jgi:hypothetical protein
MDHRLHHGYFRVIREQGKTGPHDRFAAYRPVLLGQIATGTKPAPSGDDNGSNREAHLHAPEETPEKA